MRRVPDFLRRHRLCMVMCDTHTDANLVCHIYRSVYTVAGMNNYMNDGSRGIDM